MPTARWRISCGRSTTRSWRICHGVQRSALDRARLGQGVDGAPATDERMVATAFLSVIERIGAQTPVLLTIDDAQWLDASSRAVLGYSSRRLTGRIGFALSFRTGDPDAADARTWLQFRRPDSMASVQIQPLSLGAVHALVAERLGRTLPRPTITRIYQISGGNPLFAMELAAGAATDVASTHRRTARQSRRAGPSSCGRHQCRRRRGAARRGVQRQTDGRVDRPCHRHAHRTRRRGARGDGRAAHRRLDGQPGALHASAVRHRRIRQRHRPRGRAMHRTLAALVERPEERARHLALAATTGDPDTLAALDAAADATVAQGAPAVAAELVDLAMKLGGDTARGASAPANCTSGRVPWPPRVRTCSRRSTTRRRDLALYGTDVARRRRGLRRRHGGCGRGDERRSRGSRRRSLSGTGLSATLGDGAGDGGPSRRSTAARGEGRLNSPSARRSGSGEPGVVDLGAGQIRCGARSRSRRTAKSVGTARSSRRRDHLSSGERRRGADLCLHRRPRPCPRPNDRRAATDARGGHRGRHHLGHSAFGRDRGVVWTLRRGHPRRAGGRRARRADGWTIRPDHGVGRQAAVAAYMGREADARPAARVAIDTPRRNRCHADGHGADDQPGLSRSVPWQLRRGACGTAALPRRLRRDPRDRDRGKRLSARRDRGADQRGSNRRSRPAHRGA